MAPLRVGQCRRAKSVQDQQRPPGRGVCHFEATGGRWQRALWHSREVWGLLRRRALNPPRAEGQGTLNGDIVIQEGLAPLYIVTFTGKVSDAEFDAYLRELSTLTERPGRRAMVYDARLATPSPASQRQMQAAWMKRFDADVRNKTAGIAFVLPSALMRGMLTAILWLQPLACPHHVTTDFTDGVGWARARLGTTPPKRAFRG